jgi:HD-GYP domain-containing protein (c-di-GMP phosphodiesterase class II)
MKQHPEIGHRILQGAVDSQILAIVRHHHERFDGTGYPDGLKGDEIPIGARCLLVADAFDAMTSHRIYRKALPMERVIDELRRHSGTQFDPEIVKVFLSILEEGKLAPFYKGNTELSIETAG